MLKIERKIKGDRAGTFYERSHPSGEEGGGSGGGADRLCDRT